MSTLFPDVRENKDAHEKANKKTVDLSAQYEGSCGLPVLFEYVAVSIVEFFCDRLSIMYEYLILHIKPLLERGNFVS